MVLSNALFIVGEIGGNDYGYPLSQPWGLEELKTYVPQVVSAITSTISVRILTFVWVIPVYSQVC